MNNFSDKYKEDIEFLERVTGKSIRMKLNNDRNEINLISTISEIRFGKYLAVKFGSNIEYEPVILGKTPDWLVNINGDKIIFEVLRINLPNEKLEEKIRLFKENELDIDSSGVYTGLACLNRNDSDKILKKEKTYRSLIKTHNYKLVICIDATDWDKKIDVMDIKTSFDFENKESPFYHMNFTKNVAGLIVEPYFGNIEFIFNQNVNNKLNKKNIDILIGNS
tara:strand:+ start:516 stop:1181 length:666 start_codon:yes stop_codon:yes gene_type:complete